MKRQNKTKCARKARITPNQILRNEIERLKSDLTYEKKTTEKLSEILSNKRVNEQIEDSRNIYKFFHNLEVTNYKREETITATLKIIESAMRGAKTNIVYALPEAKSFLSVIS